MGTGIIVQHQIIWSWYTLVADGWAVTFGTAMRGLGGAAAHRGPSPGCNKLGDARTLKPFFACITSFYLYYLLSPVLSSFICITFLQLYVTNWGWPAFGRTVGAIASARTLKPFFTCYTFFYLYCLLSLVFSYFICITFLHLYVTNWGVGQHLGEPDIKTYLHLYYLLLPLLPSLASVIFFHLYYLISSHLICSDKTSNSSENDSWAGHARLRYERLRQPITN